MVFCHGSFYATTLNGQGGPGKILKLNVDDTYSKLTTTLIVEVPAPMNAVLGLACDPRDDDSNFKLYFTHSAMYHQKGAAPMSPYPYLSAVCVFLQYIMIIVLLV